MSYCNVSYVGIVTMNNLKIRQPILAMYRFISKELAGIVL